jgi:hypothetical protein
MPEFGNEAFDGALSSNVWSEDYIFLCPVAIKTETFDPFLY